MTEKRCTKCGEWKLFSEFSKDKQKKDGYTCHCKNCHNAYRQENRDYILDKAKEYQIINQERLTNYRKKHYKENRNRILEEACIYRESNRELLRERDRQYYERYYKTNPGRFYAKDAKRRASKKSTVTTDPWELNEIALFYSDCPKGYHVDHIIPLALGGRHELSNLQHLEAWMNLNKNDKHPDDWDDPRPVSCRA
jgi:5-methylcytosine-specific restriction endonuclease McrA